MEQTVGRGHCMAEGSQDTNELTATNTQTYGSGTWQYGSDTWPAWQYELIMGTWGYRLQG